MAARHLDRHPCCPPKTFKPALIEPLEERRLLAHTFSGAGEFEFLDAAQNWVRVDYSRVTFQIMWSNASATLVDINDGFAGGPLNGDIKDDLQVLAALEVGHDIYAIHVIAAEPGSYISIGGVPEPQDDPNSDQTRSLQIWSDGPDAFVVNTVVNSGELGRDVEPPGEIGTVWIGGRIVPTDTGGGGGPGGPGGGGEDAPIQVFDDLRLPGGVSFANTNPGRILRPGLYVDSGQILERFLLGGTITGRVDVRGSMDLFYAGWILTGRINGQNLGAPLLAHNFRVLGDLHSLVTAGPLGTDGVFIDDEPNRPHYITGVDIDIRGNLGQLTSEEAIIANVRVQQHRQAADSLRYRREIEHTGRGFLDIDDDTAFEVGLLGGNDEIENAAFRNDTFDTPEYLGTINRGRTETITVRGELWSAAVDPAEFRDGADYYGLALLSDQLVNIKLSLPNDGAWAPEQRPFRVGIFDPDGRLIATDYELPGQEFKFRSGRPGVYRIAIAAVGDVNFSGSEDISRSGIDEQEFSAAGNYRLTVKHAGDLSLGGISAGTHFFAHNVPGSRPAIEVERGDFGALFAGEHLLSHQLDATVLTISSRRGNLRSFEANQIGYIDEGINTSGINIDAPRGSVGLIRAAEMAQINPGLTAAQITPIGRDYQLIDVATGDLSTTTLVANGAIGVIRADSIGAEDGAWIFMVDADNRGRDGIIDLIDVAGDFGNLQDGGPQISTGPGGNVRYIHVGGDAYQDRAFGGGGRIETELDEGESLHLTDDSGAEIELRPTRRRNPAFRPGVDPTEVPPFIAGTLTVRTYGIRSGNFGAGGGGVVVIDVSSTESVEVTSTGKVAEVTHVMVEGEGPELTTNSDGKPLMPAASSRPLNVLFEGSARLDVFRISGVDDELPNFTRIENKTIGEIVNVQAASIGLLSGHTLGLARNHTGAPVDPIEVRSDFFPYHDQRIGILVGEPSVTVPTDPGGEDPGGEDPGGEDPGGEDPGGGSVAGIARVHARYGLGNFIVEDGIGELYANDDGDSRVGFEGINAPVYAGELFLVSIGEGILPSGSGDVSFAGLYSSGRIDEVVNQGKRSDIRGDISSLDSIGTIALRDGSIINSDIFVATILAAGQVFSASLSFPDSDESQSSPTFEIEDISVSGFGGIVGARIGAADVGNVTVDRGGFGIFETSMVVVGEGWFDRVRADGYGLRDVRIEGGAFAGLIEAFGKGKVLSTEKTSPSVRLSERHKRFDPYFLIEHSEQTDLHAYLGTSRQQPTNGEVTRTGMIDYSRIVGQRNLGRLKAFQIRDGTEVNFANNVGRIETVRGIVPMTPENPLSTVRFTTGAIREFHMGGDVVAADLRMSGRIDDLKIRGDLAENSILFADGPDGYFDTVKINGNLHGTLRAFKGMRYVKIGRELTGTLKVDSRTGAPMSLERLIVRRHIRNGDIDVQGGVGKIIVSRDIRRGVIRAGSINLLKMRNISGDVRVVGDMKRFISRGDVQSGADISVGRRLGVLRVADDIEFDVIVTADQLGKERVRGDIFGDVLIG